MNFFKKMIGAAVIAGAAAGATAGEKQEPGTFENTTKPGASQSFDGYSVFKGVEQALNRSGFSVNNTSVSEYLVSLGPDGTSLIVHKYGKKLFAVPIANPEDVSGLATEIRRKIDVFADLEHAARQQRKVARPREMDIPQAEQKPWEPEPITPRPKRVPKE